VFADAAAIIRDEARASVSIGANLIGEDTHGIPC
jgi:hypothetical protein